jgi:septal ring factor EnvC (AmiA/AmiB activator)
MSQRDGFASGFFAGAIFGSIVGGIVGTIVASRRDLELEAEQEHQMNGNLAEAKKASNLKRRQMRAAESESMEMEMARRSLEDKIAQLNATIDEVRQQLGNVNGNSGNDMNEHPSIRDDLR